ncbi:MAG: (d)CMP kinase [Firmicutes bacterium]|nr:(d)CMP kinase [[Eubacterium] siraeum]MCM1488725.1 (d)CMP kinase [Bacillota bacterium]
MISVAIDGPVGAGKSTVARESAKRLGFIYADTGALYRAVALYSIRKGLSEEDTDFKEKVTALLPEIQVEIKIKEGEQRVFLNSEDVSEEIRLPQISMAASAVSSIPAVRDFLLELQRDIAKKNNVLMDGRDIGTVVLPHANVKIFITASPEIRAKRRFAELINKGVETGYEQVLNDLNRRDYQDSHRAVAPLKMAEDAKLLDTSELSFEQSVEKVVELVKKAEE